MRCVSVLAILVCAALVGALVWIAKADENRELAITVAVLAFFLLAPVLFL